MMMGKLLNISLPQFPYLKNSDKNSVFSKYYCEILDKLIGEKHLEEYLLSALSKQALPTNIGKFITL